MVPYYLGACALAAVLAAAIWLPWRARHRRRRLRVALTGPLVIALIATLWILHELQAATSDLGEAIGAGVSHMGTR